ncbi:hypothetical protein ACFL2C_00465 [Patescibacteria group bacterium]
MSETTTLKEADPTFVLAKAWILRRRKPVDDSLLLLYQLDDHQNGKIRDGWPEDGSLPEHLSHLSHLSPQKLDDQIQATSHRVEEMHQALMEIKGGNQFLKNSFARAERLTQERERENKVHT